MFKKIESLKQLKAGVILKPSVGNKEHRATEFEIIYVPTIQEEIKTGKGTDLKNLSTGAIEGDHIKLHLLTSWKIKV